MDQRWTTDSTLVKALIRHRDTVSAIYPATSAQKVPTHKPRPLIDLLIGIVIPFVVLMKLSGNNDLGATGALIFADLRWSWAIGLGYAASIWVHFLINAESF